MNTLERLKAEEAEAEAAFRTPSAPQVLPPQDTFEAEPLDQTQDELDAATFMTDIVMSDTHEDAAELEETVLGEVEQEIPKQNRTNWKRRFTNFKASADTTIFELRQEVASLQSSLAHAKGEVQSLRNSTTSAPVDAFDGVFSEQDEATFGTDGLDIVKKATKTAIDKATKPLKDQLDKAEADRISSLRAQAASHEAASYGKFISDLENLAPDYKEVNVNPGFLEWMKLPDTYSGITRAKLFSAAEGSKDVSRVAEFFVEYSNLVKPTKPADPMDKHITPVGGGSASSTPRNNKGTKDQVVILQSEINAFYTSVSKGHYAGRHDEVLAIEAQIDQALLEGRIKQG